MKYGPPLSESTTQASSPADPPGPSRSGEVDPHDSSGSSGESTEFIVEPLVGR